MRSPVKPIAACMLPLAIAVAPALTGADVQTALDLLLRALVFVILLA